METACPDLGFGQAKRVAWSAIMAHQRQHLSWPRTARNKGAWSVLAEIRKHGHMLTRDCYVGAEAREDDGEPCEEK